MTEKKTMDATTHEKDREAVNWWGDKLLWGMFFIVVGAILLLANLNVISIELSSLWRLWPIAIIIVGLSVLSLRGWLGRVVYGLAALVVAALVWMTMTGVLGSNSAVATEQYSIEPTSEDIKRLHVDIKAGASAIDITSGVGPDLVTGSFNSSATRLQKSSREENDTQKVNLALDHQWGWWSGGAQNVLSVILGRKMPTSVSIDAGASSINADLSEVKVESLKIDSGASSIKAKLGTLAPQMDVTIDTGVSSVEVQLPSTAGVKLVLDGGLSSKSLPEGLTEMEEGVYRSRNYDDATYKISLAIDMGVSSLKITTY